MTPMPRCARIPARLIALVASAAIVCACSTAAKGPSPTVGLTPAPQALGTLGPGFYDPKAPPSPEGTITPSPGSWDAVHPKPGYTAALLIDGVPSGTSAQTAVLRDAVTSWASAEKVHLTQIIATTADDYVADIQQAIAGKPDLVISVGDGFVDPLALVTASNLLTQFLVVGAETAEPTGNVTAADWAGGSFRGEGLGQSSTYDPTSFTPERAGRAIRAGVAAVLNGLTGIVIWLS
jgi:hypothetical protein